MTLILTHSDITSVLDRHEVRKAVERAHAGLAFGECQNPRPGHSHCPRRGWRYRWSPAVKGWPR